MFILQISCISYTITHSTQHYSDNLSLVGKNKKGKFIVLYTFYIIIFLKVFHVHNLCITIFRRKDYNLGKLQLWTLLLALLGVYPQYKCVKYLTQKNVEKAKSLKDEYSNGIGLLEPWLESTMQVRKL